MKGLPSPVAILITNNRGPAHMLLSAFAMYLIRGALANDPVVRQEPARDL